MDDYHDATPPQTSAGNPSVAYHLSPTVHGVAVKLPPFWPDRPAVWFAQVEANFEIANITADRTKYNYIVSNLTDGQAANIEDILANPPKDKMYDFLKTELIRRLSVSEEQRLNKLLGDEELGERKPSQFLRHLRSLAGPSLRDEVILRQLWMRRIPQHVQAILAAQSELPLNSVAALADRIIEVSPGRPSICAAGTSSSDTSLQAITRRLEELSCQVAALQSSRSRQNDREAHRSRSRSRSESRSRFRSESRPDLCWYHRKFGEMAQHCTSPCKWTGRKPENQAGSQ